jgi:hypothetical protein
MFFYIAEFNTIGTSLDFRVGEEDEDDGSELALCDGFTVAAFFVLMGGCPADLSLSHVGGAGDMGGDNRDDGVDECNASEGTPPWSRASLQRRPMRWRRSFSAPMIWLSPSDIRLSVTLIMMVQSLRATPAAASILIQV